MHFNSDLPSPTTCSPQPQDPAPGPESPVSWCQAGESAQEEEGLLEAKPMLGSPETTFLCKEVPEHPLMIKPEPPHLPEVWWRKDRPERGGGLRPLWLSFSLMPSFT
uniref:Uncharacterized protein n=1 Tax=Piliocolobus tephrosceles TaxID=591936 RepID=A0A8C9I9Q0_9PRIM